MNTISKKGFLAIASLFAMLFAVSSCEDSLGIQVTPEAPNADKTLYEVIMQDKDLTDFVEILNACNIPSSKNPNEIISVADSLFNTSRVYTVWAPVNSFLKNKKDSILERIRDGYRDDVMKTFVCSHVANFLKPAKGRFDEDGDMILMLNDKKQIFAGSYNDENGYTFGGNRLASVNNRAKNGLLHKLESSAEYNYNIWEYLKIYPQASTLYKVDSLVNYLYSFNDTVYPDYLKVVGPIVDGVQTYLDSVPDYQNELLTKYGGVGNIDKEDSLYTFYLPTNDVWDEMMEKAAKHFNYALTASTDTALVDSLKHYYSRYNFIKYLTYSEKEQKYVDAPDSVMPAQYEYKRKLFARSDLDNCVVETKEMSNGTIKIINEFPYSVFDLWHDTIRVEAENTSYIDENVTKMNLLKRYTVYDKDINKEVGEKLSGSQYIVYGDGDANSQTTLSYYLPNVKSATYEIKLIFVPRNIKNSKLDISKDLSAKLNFYVYALDSTKVAEGNVTIIASLENKEIDKNRIDTVSLGKVTFPMCEYNVAKKVTDYKASILINGKNRPQQKKNNNNIFLDAILLIPVEPDPVEDK